MEDFRFSNWCFSKTTDLISQSKAFYFCLNLQVKVSILFIDWNPNGGEMPELFVIWTHLNFETSVCPKL